MASIRFEKSEELLRSFVKLSEEHGAEVITALPYGEKWIVLRVEVCDKKPDLTAEAER